MMTSRPTPTEPITPVPPARTWARRAGLLVGALLLVAAVVVVWRQRGAIGDALGQMRHPSPLHVVVLLVAVALNVMMSGVVFSLLYSRYGRVGRLEMQAVIAGATLLNYLPMRAGMFGRIAYHRTVNDIAVRDSAKVIGQGLALSIVVAAYLALSAWTCARTGWPLWGAVLLGVALMLVAAVAWRDGRTWCLAGAVRIGELIVWAVRYWAAFALLGLDLDAPAAVAFACIGVVAILVPFVSNGLGLREWAVGLVAPLLTGYQLELGLAAELLNRAAELVMVTGLGVVGLAYLARRRRTL
jgi:hypothetical protein